MHGSGVGYWEYKNIMVQMDLIHRETTLVLKDALSTNVFDNILSLNHVETRMVYQSKTCHLALKLIYW